MQRQGFSNEKGETGAIITKILPVSEFNSIKLSSSIDITLSQGPTQEVKVIGHLKNINKLLTSVSDNMWEIELENSYYHNLSLSVEITVPIINKIILNGSGDVVINDFFNQDALVVNLEGSGDCTLNVFEDLKTLDVSIDGSGKFKSNKNINALETLTLSINGSGDYYGFKISSKNSIVESSGSGDIELTALDSLNVNINGSGDIFYKGTPRILQRTSGSGELINTN